MRHRLQFHVMSELPHYVGPVLMQNKEAECSWPKLVIFFFRTTEDFWRERTVRWASNIEQAGPRRLFVPVLLAWASSTLCLQSKPSFSGWLGAAEPPRQN